MTAEHNHTTDIVPVTPGKLINSDKALAIRRGQAAGAGGFIQHISFEDVRAMVRECRGERDRLLIRFLFESCCRVTEAISVRPADMVNDADGWQVRVLGKGAKRRAVAISAGIAAELQAYAYRSGIQRDKPLFPVTRTRVFQIVTAAMNAAGVAKPDGVGAVHVLRHSGALHRLAVTGHPKALQDQLGHSQATMTIRYMKTLQQEESLKIQQGVSFDW